MRPPCRSLTALSALALVHFAWASPSSAQHPEELPDFPDGRLINGLSPHTALLFQLEADASALGLEPHGDLPRSSAVATTSSTYSSLADDRRGSKGFAKRRLASDAGQFEYGKTKVRGVSLGGWLVLEAFIKPSFFEKVNKKDKRIQDEYTFCQYTPKAEAQAALADHWATWITEDDIKEIAAAGLNHVRIPIGFWALDVSGGEPYIQGSMYYLRLAVAWAAEHGLHVLIDLHGAPGSQNAYDNSGRRGQLRWHLHESNVRRTENVLLALATEFTQAKYRNVVTAITPLNEPAGYRHGVTEVAVRYYEDAYKLVRSVGETDPMFLYHDAFMPATFWNGFLPDAHNEGLDTHIYTVFRNDWVAMNDSARIKFYCDKGDIIAESETHRMTIVGEWTPSNTDCSQKMDWVTYREKDTYQQIGWGSRYDGTLPGSTVVGSCKGKSGNAEGFSDEHKRSLRKFAEVQMDQFERGSGWYMWAWKMENSDDWSYQAGLEGGWTPRNITERLYGDQCA